MITRVVLENWRAFEHLDIRLSAGTTFVVARNGLGKSSFVEGARWALFGGASRSPISPVRLGASFATASVEVVLPSGAELRVSRTLPRRLTKARPATVSATLNGESLDEERLGKVLLDELGAEPSFLAHVTTLGREDLDEEASSLNLNDHLCRFFGIDRVRALLENLRARQKAIEGDVRSAKESEGMSPRQLKELRESAAAAEREAESAQETLTEMQSLADAASRAVRAAEDHVAWQERRLAQGAQLEELSLAVTQRVGSRLDASDLPQALDGLEHDATGRIDLLRRRQSELAGRAEAIRSALEQLSEDAAACPVCRRPLTVGDVETARLAHEREAQGIELELAKINVDDDVELLSFIRDARRRVSELSSLEPEPPVVALDEAKERLLETEESLATARDATVERRAVAMAASRGLREAEQRIRESKELARRFKSLGLVTAAIEVNERTVESVLDNAFEPLAREVSERWNLLFGERGPLRLSGQGAVTRALNGEELPFAAFSTGEKMGAQILLRLLILGSATKAEFCWIDEPLEHLDPDARRQVASMLAVTPATSSIRQVLVTTYEEPLVRRLSEGMFGDAKVLYLRTPADPAVE